MFQKIIGLFLHIANSSPPLGFRREFYQLKEKLLKKYGASCGYDIQHIRKTCRTCDGTGVYRHGGYREHCCRCNNGVYEEFYVVLQKYHISKYLFHIPGGKIYKPYYLRTTIEGYIQHNSYGYLSDECFYWLALFFAPQLFIRAIGVVGFPCRRYTPMVILGNIMQYIRFTAPIKAGALYAKIKGCVQSLCLGRKSGGNGFEYEDMPF